MIGTPQKSRWFLGVICYIMISILPVTANAATEADHFHTLSVYDICESGDYIYCLTTVGAKRIHKTTGIVEKCAPEGLEDLSFYGIKRAPDGTVWLWGLDKSTTQDLSVLFSFNGKVWSDHQVILPEGIITGIDIDEQNRVWMLTYITIYTDHDSSYIISCSVYDGADCKKVYTISSGMPIYSDPIYSEATNSIWAKSNENGYLQVVVTPDDTTWVDHYWRPFGDKPYAIDQKGTLWCISRENQLLSVTDEDITVYENWPEDADWLFIDSKDRLWLRTPSGLKRYDNEDVYPYDLESFLSVTEDEDGTFWFGTYRGIVKFDGKEFEELVSSELPANWSNDIEDVFVDANGIVWCLTNSAIHYYNGDIWVEYTSSMPTTIRNPSIAVDHDGNIWIATDGTLYGSDGGFYRFDGTSWMLTSDTIGNLNFHESDICVDADGSVWVVVNDNSSVLYRYIDNEWHLVEGISTSHTKVIASDPYEGIWVGARNNLYHVAPDGQSEVIPGTPRKINTIAVSESGIVWVGWEEGLSTYSDGEWTFQFQSPLGTAIRSLAIDTINRVLLGTWSHGMYSFESDTVSHYSVSNGLIPSNQIRQVVVDQENNIWVTTVGITRIAADEQSPDTIEYLYIPDYDIVSISPNPFNSSTSISIAIPRDTENKIVIYNMLGQKIRVLLDEWLDAGMHTFVWDGRDEKGLPVPSGVYICRFGTLAQKMTLLR